MIVEPNPLSGSSIFCDDVRTEDNGKEIFIGVYAGAMVFPAGETFPLRLPSLAICVTYLEQRDYTEDKVVIKVFLPGEHEEAAVEAVVREAGPRPPLSTRLIRDHSANEEPPKTWNQVKFVIRISPIELRQEGTIRVRAFVGDKIVKLGSMAVLIAKSEDNL